MRTTGPLNLAVRLTSGLILGVVCKDIGRRLWPGELFLKERPKHDLGIIARLFLVPCSEMLWRRFGSAHVQLRRMRLL